jgi:hypothetical protein
MSSSLIANNGRSVRGALRLAPPSGVDCGLGARLILLGSLAAGVFAAEPSSAQTSTDPWDWIIQHVCADASNLPVPADPYYGCPAGTHNRRLIRGDPMPYSRHDQPWPGYPNGYQRHDAYILLDQRRGSLVSANDFDFDYYAPYGVFYPGDGDGYDVYRVVGGYVSGSGTRDGSGYSQTFWGAGCVPRNGWVFFPVSFLSQLQPGASGSGVFSIHGDYYEQSGERYPGRCDSDTRFVSPLTTWTFEPTYPFGGLNGAPQKLIDAIVSTHGFPTGAGPFPHINLERLYFTDLYGMTRWEAWKLPADVSVPSANCQGSTEMTYQDVTFELADCRDWSLVTLYPAAQPRFPWPYPEANVLVNEHFDGLHKWRHGSGLDVSVLHSTTAADTADSQNGHGVDYLQVNCAGQCWPGQAVFQNVAISAVQAGQQVDYGFSGVVQGSAGANLTVTLSLRDAEGKRLWSTSFDAAVPTNYEGITPDVSVYGASSTFLTTSPALPDLPNAASLRLSLSPTALVVYDILDAWMMPRTGISAPDSVSSSLQ